MKSLRLLLAAAALVLGSAVSAQEVLVANATTGDRGDTKLTFTIAPTGNSVTSVDKLEIWKPIDGHRDGGVWDPIPNPVVTGLGTNTAEIQLPNAITGTEKYRITVKAAGKIRSYNAQFLP